MKRDYSDGNTNKAVKFFVGNEIEKTSAYGKKTLFVVIDEGLTKEEVVDQLVNDVSIEHVYLGANKSNENKFREALLERIIRSILILDHRPIHVTIDVPYEKYANVTRWDPELMLHNRVHVNLSVPVDNIKRIKNLTIKIDDIGFNITNDGVWCFELDKHPECKTTWDEYKDDKIIE